MKTDLRIIFQRLVKKILKIGSPIKETQLSDFDLDLFIRCFKEAGATITPGTGKIFVDGKEVSFEELFKVYESKN